jgi:hypothetical protein
VAGEETFKDNWIGCAPPGLHRPGESAKTEETADSWEGGEGREAALRQGMRRAAHPFGLWLDDANLIHSEAPSSSRWSGNCRRETAA